MNNTYKPRPFGRYIENTEALMYFFQKSVTTCVVKSSSCSQVNFVCIDCAHAFRFYSDFVHGRESNRLILIDLRLIIIWLCLMRTGNYHIHEFKWLKWILTAV